jgi:hypothetical protein
VELGPQTNTKKIGVNTSQSKRNLKEKEVKHVEKVRIWDFDGSSWVDKLEALYWCVGVQLLPKFLLNFPPKFNLI